MMKEDFEMLRMGVEVVTTKFLSTKLSKLPQKM